MSFLYPFFLLSGLLVVIPILIHLFNLRRYKTVYFPHTRFLKNIQLRSQKQSQVRYKWLLAARILFLLLLVLAFAQPYFHKKNDANDVEGLQVIYLDNSPSMSVKKGARTLFDIAMENARKQLLQAHHGSRYLLLTNDKPVSYQPVSADKALTMLNGISISASSRNASQLFSMVQGLMQSNAITNTDLYYYSDFQKNIFPATPAENELQNIRFYGMPVRADAVSNVYIDTAILTSPVLKTGENNQLVVTTKYVGQKPKELPALQLYMNGQVKTASSLSFDDKGESVDTLSFQVKDAGWQELKLVINDAVRFDDTFRIAARSNSNLSVLVLNENQPNPFIQAAFRAYNGFRLDNKQPSESIDWKAYNLIILNGFTQINESLTKQLQQALSQGQSIVLFPGKTNDWRQINKSLSQILPLEIVGIDTATQNATSIQQGSDLIKDIFEHIPDNVQLPQANWHYKINAELSANQQSIISFRNGDPLLAMFTPARGKFYLLTTAVDLQSGNFPTSYFFAPFLFQMTSQSATGNEMVTTAGSEQPVYVTTNNTNEHNMLHIYGEGLDIIPPQRAAGAGLDVFAGKVITQAGFYKLSQAGNDTVILAVNQDRRESQLDLWSLKTLTKEWKGKNIFWADTNSLPSAIGQGDSYFPLWKVCAILALIMLAIETWLLATNYRKTRIAAS